jgi:hypothetical protein
MHFHGRVEARELRPIYARKSILAMEEDACASCESGRGGLALSAP